MTPVLLACGHGWPVGMAGLWHCISEPHGAACGGQGCSKNPSLTCWAAKGWGPVLAQGHDLKQFTELWDLMTQLVRVPLPRALEAGTKKPVMAAMRVGVLLSSSAGWNENPLWANNTFNWDKRTLRIKSLMLIVPSPSLAGVVGGSVWGAHESLCGNNCTNSEHFSKPFA